MPNRRYYGDAGGNIGITFSPDESVKLNPNFDPSQDVSATNPVTMASKQGFLRKLLGGSGSEADRFNAEAALRQALTKQAFNNQMAMQQQQDTAAMLRQAAHDRAALEQALAVQEAQSKSQIEGQLRVSRLAEDRDIERLRNITAQEREKELSKARDEGEATMMAFPNFMQQFGPVRPEIAAQVASKYGGTKAGLDGFATLPSRVKADIAVNEATEKTAMAQALSKAMTQVGPGQFAFIPGMADQPAVTGITRDKIYVPNPITGMPEEREVTVPAGVTDSPAAIQQRNEQRKARLQQAGTAPQVVTQTTNTTAPINPFRAELETRVSDENLTKNQEQLGDYRAQIRRLQERIKAGGRPVSEFNPYFLKDTEEEQRKFLQQAAQLEDLRQTLLKQTMKARTKQP